MNVREKVARAIYNNMAFEPKDPHFEFCKDSYLALADAAINALIEADIARLLARSLFALGDEPNSKCQRLQFMCGEYPDNEIEGGGICEIALHAFFDRKLRQLQGDK